MDWVTLKESIKFPLKEEEFNENKKKVKKVLQSIFFKNRKIILIA